MEKKGWKITGIIFIVLFAFTFITLFLVSGGVGTIYVEHDTCRNTCANSYQCLSYQYDVNSGNCTLIDMNSIEGLVDQYLEEQGFDVE